MSKIKPSFKLSNVTLAMMTSGLIAYSGALYAQEDNQKEVAEQVENIEVPEKMEVIEVTGFRRSLIQSINQKRFADTVTEQLSADDLGSLPDVSMADALTRLPGISAVRTGGQAAEINIRGMSGGFVSTTLNGREQVSTGGKRSVEFDQYPSELISKAAVYKSPKVSLIEGGVAGTVELTTASPLSNEKDHSFSINARGMYNDLAADVPDATSTGHRFSVSYQGKFADETLGVALGYARLFQPSATAQFVGLNYSKLRDVDNLDNDTNGPTKDNGVNINKEYISEGFEIQHKGGEETRDGFMATLEWQPTDNFKLKTDGFYSKFTSEEFARGFRVKFEGDQAAISNPVLHENSVIGGNISRTTNSATRIEIVNDDNSDVDEVQSFGINADWQITERLNMNMDLSYSSANSEFQNGLIWALVAQDANADVPKLDSNVSINYLLNGLDLPDIGLNQAGAFTDLNKVMVSKYGIYPYVNSDEVSAVRVDFTYELDNDYITSIEVGARYSEREYSNDRSVFEYGSDSSLSSLEAPLRITEDMATIVNWSGNFSNFPSYLALDQDKILKAWFPDGRPNPVQTWGDKASGVINGAAIGKTSDWTMKESGQVYEDVLSIYVMANINTEIAGIPVTGNFGVRMVETTQASTSLQDVGLSTKKDQYGQDIKDAQGNPIEFANAELGAQFITDEVGLINQRYFSTVISNTYRDYLPQINLNFQLSESDQIRFAAAKVMSRPNIERLASNSSYNINVVNTDGGSYAKISGQAKNSPHLKPFYANQYDISYEKYFTETDGKFVAAVFYKDIESAGIITQTITEYDFAGNGFAVPEVYTDPLSGIPLEVRNGDFETAFNDEAGGYIRGIELGYTQIFSFLPELWSGLGFDASYSHTESEIQQISQLGQQNLAISLPGLSENVLQTTLFWEYQGFETRLSVRYRDEFVSEQVAVEAQTVNYDGETVLDYQASYQVNDNLGLVFQVNNLTDEPTKSYFGETAQTGTLQYFGRQFFLGLTYSL
ncbi:TonB-dependent receptor [Colwellia sp. BRX10-3]|uniref:TonB-dependent receptor n=1 Tax=Colwellia sp. BRX10-3 TaxID=2759844 RepID=UPI0015F48E4F|nr:TonB-dependent receptor [Colwellia sp. BRX10-3]MBA6389216.1 TonB-dependent receptor [Colwellia sp. BRX10-3]